MPLAVLSVQSYRNPDLCSEKSLGCDAAIFPAPLPLLVAPDPRWYIRSTYVRIPWDGQAI